MKRTLWLLLCSFLMSCQVKIKRSHHTPKAGEDVFSSVGYEEINGDYVGGQGSPMVKSFYNHAFSTWSDRPRVVVYSRWDKPLKKFEGVYIYLDGESEGLLGEHKDFAQKMLYVGPRSDTEAKRSVYIPFVSLSYGERESNPLDLLLPSPQAKMKKPYFAAYLVSNCVAFREAYYDQLVELTRKHQLGEVHALSSCYGHHPETRKEIDPSKGRKNSSFMDSAVDILKDYQFVLTVENAVVDGYITEKPLNALLAGSIPIYVGSDKILSLLNPASFIYLESSASLEEALLPVALDPQRIAAMQQEAPLESVDKLYTFSWHRHVEEFLMKAGKDTMRREIEEAMRFF